VSAELNTAGVVSLQKQLHRIAHLRQKTMLDPATYNGTMTLGTVVALFNTTVELGQTIPGIGPAFDVIAWLRHELDSIPYGGTIFELLVSPWVVDKVVDAVLAILGLFHVSTTAIKKGLDAAQSAIASSAAPIAAGLAAAAGGLHGTGAHGIGFSGALGLIAPGQGLPTCMPGQNPKVDDCWPRCGQIPGPAQYWSQRALRCKPVPLCPATPPPWPQGDWVFDPGTEACVPGGHRTGPWQPGYPIRASDWSAYHDYSGAAKLGDLAADDLVQYLAQRDFTQIVLKGDPIPYPQKLAVIDGTWPWATFVGSGGALMGVFYQESTGHLRIGVWDPPLNVQTIIDKAEEVEALVEKYGCALVNNDIVVAVAAVGVGFIATPAAGAAVAAAAQTAKGACTVLKVSEALYAIYELLSRHVPAPPDLSTSDPPLEMPAGLVNLLTEDQRLGPVLLSLLDPNASRIVLPPLARRYAPGSVAVYHRSKKSFQIYSPSTGGLGAAAVVPAGFVLVAELKTLPKDVRFLGEVDSPFYQKPVFWAFALGSVAVVGGTTALVIGRHRRRRSAS
jgi:hypothetical protein